MPRILGKEGQKVFSIDYIPEYTPFREEVINDIIDYISTSISEENYRPIIIAGSSGTGKTLVATKVVNHLVSDDYLSNNVAATLINATIANSIYAVIKKIAGFITPIPERGLSISDIIRRLETTLTSRRIRYIIALDDADEIIKKERGKLVYILTRMDEEAHVPLIYPIFILRDMKVLTALPDHIRSKIGGPIYKFNPYNRSQLKEIIRERIEKGLNPGAISENAIEVSSINTEVIFGGNAREMINLIYRSALYAEKLKLNKIDAEIIRETFFYTFYNNIVNEVRHPLLKETIKQITEILDRDEYMISEDHLNRLHKEMNRLGVTRKELLSYLDMLSLEYGYLLKEETYKHTFIPRRFIEK